MMNRLLRHKKLLIFVLALILAALVLGFAISRRAAAPGGTVNTTDTSTHPSSKKSKKSSDKPAEKSEPKPLPQPQAPSSKPAAFNRYQYSTTAPGSLWVIANKKHPLNPKTYAPGDLVATGGGQYMRAEAARALTRMLADAAAAGYTVSPASGYRSYSTQVTVYSNEVKQYGKKVADSESARPGYSEHQTGLAMDLASGGCSITDCFGDTPGGKWVTANAYKYGFILRYPAGKSGITGYRTETWHFRYVGIGLATEMHNKGIKTLEEFFGVSGGDYE